jgi:hypothetical protein
MYAISRFHTVQIASLSTAQASWLCQPLVRKEWRIQTVLAQSETVLLELGRFIMQNGMRVEVRLELRGLMEPTLLWCIKVTLGTERIILLINRVLEVTAPERVIQLPKLFCIKDLLALLVD